MKSFLVTLGLAILPLSALADTDYTCLKACVADGISHATCIPKCSYEPLANADIAPITDFTCLKACSDSGTKAGACMPRCTMALPQTSTPAKPNPAQSDVHDAFTTLLPVDQVLLPAKKKPLPIPSTDAFCMKFCLAGNLQYALCQRHCIK